MLGMPKSPLTLVGAEGDQDGPGITQRIDEAYGHPGACACDCTAAHSAPAFWITWPYVTGTGWVAASHPANPGYPAELQTWDHAVADSAWGSSWPTSPPSSVRSRCRPR
jgi:hypothetical protein